MKGNPRDFGKVERDWITDAGLRAVARLNYHPEWNLIPPELVGIKQYMQRQWRCGYVLIPPSHALHGIDAQEPLPALLPIFDRVREGGMGKRSIIDVAMSFMEHAPTLSLILNVHWSITWTADASQPSHILPTVEGGGTWYGFDTAHCDDHYLGLDYVERECESLAEQLAMLHKELTEHKEDTEQTPSERKAQHD